MGKIKKIDLDYYTFKNTGLKGSDLGGLAVKDAIIKINEVIDYISEKGKKNV
jgi:hypothetical protein